LNSKADVTRLAPLPLVFALAGFLTGAVAASQNNQDTPPQPSLTFKSGVDLVSVSVVVSSIVASAAPRLVYSIVRVIGASSSPHDSMPKSPEPEARMSASIASATSTTPEPTW